MHDHQMIDGIMVEIGGHDAVMEALRALWDALGDEERRGAMELARRYTQVGAALKIPSMVLTGSLSSAMISQLLYEKQRAMKGN